MDLPQSYDHFDLDFSRGPTGYQARVRSLRGGDPVSNFASFSDAELATLAAHTPAASRDDVRDARPRTAAPTLDLRDLGTRLYAAVFTEPVHTALMRARDAASERGRGVCIRLLFGDDVPELAALPWEYLYAPDLGGYLAQSEWTPVVRFLRLPVPPAAGGRPAHVTPPLVVLAVVANPTDVRPLAVEAEWQRLSEALAPLVKAGDLRLERLGEEEGVHPTLTALADRLRDPKRGPVHVLHFIGHGYFDAEDGPGGQGGLVFEKADGTADFVSAEDVATTLRDHTYIRLAFLNACQGARAGTAGSGPAAPATATVGAGSLFGGVAQRLVKGGAPVVVAMQHPISDGAALDLAGRFYRSLAEGRPIDAALSAARAVVRTPAGGVPEWGTPVLFSRSDDNRLFDPPDADPAAKALADALSLVEEIPRHEVPAVSPKLPAGSRMPYRANPLFVGRTEDLLALAEGLRGGATVAVGQTAAATGAGGIGKTQLAVEFAHRYGRFFAGGVFWLSFADAAGVKTEIAACGGPQGLDLPGFADLKLDDQVGRVQAAWSEPLPRLLVFDNCEAEELLAEWRPATGGCRVLVTSRRDAWSVGLGVQVRKLDVLPRAESIKLLLKFRPDLAGDPCPDEIAQELGDLPLALHLAGSYLARYKDDVTPPAYLTELRRPGLLAHESLTEGDWSPTGHEQDVGRTFKLSLDRLHRAEAGDTLARQVLARLACFAPGEPVPRDLLRLTMPGAQEEPEKTKTAMARAINRLAELGLVERVEGGDVRLHRLVAAFVLAALPDAGAQEAVEIALYGEARRLNAAGFPAPLAAWQVHLRHVTERAALREDERAGGLCNELGYHLQRIGDYAGARPYFEQALSIRRHVLGENDPETAASLNNLGVLLEDLGDLQGARSSMEQALAINRAALGDKHPSTAMSLNNLGRLLQESGDLISARPYLEQALAIRRQTLDKNHPSTAATLNNLGVLFETMGDLAGAKPYYEEALAIMVQTLGDDHPATATSLNNLGLLLREMGDLAGAQPYLERTLAIVSRTLGETHPETGTALNNLGTLLYAADDFTAAGLYFEQALAVWRQAVGENHPYTAMSLDNLGLLMQKLGDREAAKAYHEQALAIRRQVRGEDHPETASSLNNLGSLLYATGDLDAARPYYEQALAIFERALGHDHRRTGTVRANLDRLLARLSAQSE